MANGIGGDLSSFEKHPKKLAEEIVGKKKSNGKGGGEEPPQEPPPWPHLADEALYGPAGAIVRTIEPHTESDPAFLLLNLHVFFGNVIGRIPHYIVEGTRHYPNLYALFVGSTSKARKGTGDGRVRQAFRLVDKGWCLDRIQSCLSSGEGLIWEVRNRITKWTKDGKSGNKVEEVVDEGVADKRLLIVQSEFAAALQVMQRQGSILSAGHDWRCDCPRHQGHSLTLADGRDGRLLVKCFGGCEWREIFGELRALGLIERRPVEINPEREVEFRRRREVEAEIEIEKLARAIERARDLYRRAEPADGSPVATYLRSRGITTPIPSTLRFLEYCPHRRGKYYPAMVAPIVNVDGHQIAVHKTFLKPDGAGKVDLPRAEQRETCGPMKGGAVRLPPYRPGSPLLVGEGIESTLSAMQLFGLPGWAALCANGIEALELPDDVREVAICADNDANGVGQRAALSACKRWEAERRSVRILLPPNSGDDFNHVLLCQRQ